MDEKQVTIPVKQLTLIKCQMCKTEQFRIVQRLRKLPAVYSPTGQPDIIIEQIFQCINCGCLYTSEILLNQKSE